MMPRRSQTAFWKPMPVTLREYSCPSKIPSAANANVRFGTLLGRQQKSVPDAQRLSAG